MDCDRQVYGKQLLEDPRERRAREEAEGKVVREDNLLNTGKQVVKTFMSPLFAGAFESFVSNKAR